MTKIFDVEIHDSRKSKFPGSTFFKIFLKRHNKSKDGTVFITPEISAPEIDGYFDLLIKELNSLRTKVKRSLLSFLFLSLSMITFSCTSTPQSDENAWLKMDNSEQVNYLVGYSQGTDTGFDIYANYKNSIYERFLAVDDIQKKQIINISVSLYQKKENLIIDWKTILLSSFSLFEGDDPEIVEFRLQNARQLLQPYLRNKPGNFWLKISNKYRLKYFNGLIEGIKTGIYIIENNLSELKTEYEGLFNTGSDIMQVAEKVNIIYKDSQNQSIEIDYRNVFPIAYLLYIGQDKDIIEKRLDKYRVKNTQ